jgi:hypothetical protein
LDVRDFLLLAETTWIHWIQERALAIVLLVGALAVVILLLVTLVTRWGQSRAMTNCVIISVIAHLLLVFVAYGTQLLQPQPLPPGYGGEMKLSLVEEGEAQSRSAHASDAQPWEETEIASTVEPPLPTPERPAPEPPSPIEGASEREPLELPTAPLSEQIAESTVELPPVKSTTPDEGPAPSDRTETAGAPTLPAARLALPATAPPLIPPAAMEPKQPQEARLAEKMPPPLMPDVPRWEPARPPLEALSPRTLESMEALELETPDATAMGSTPSELAALAPSVTPPALLPVEQSPTEPVAVPREVLLERYLNEAPTRRLGDGEIMPEPYRWRLSENRPEIAAASGGSEETEEAIRRALEWLASVQERDGSWSARRFGAGEEHRVLGQDRKGAGSSADVGVTGLALLAFLGAGCTHLEGDHRRTVEAGLAYLIRVQGSDGSLHGDAALFERTYCHGMSAMALAEALGMTGDKALRPTVEKAVRYTLASQHPLGGWRYQPGDPGDMSQFGWQVMALKNADYAGIPVPAANIERMKAFLNSVSYGRHGGQARYRANEGPSRTMTAESWWCRYLLDTGLGDAAQQEGFDYVMEELPSASGKANYYYWYYATLALHRSGDARFATWSAALVPAILERQVDSGAYRGSWNADCVWGGYGGRVYTTATATLCLESFYRYRPKSNSDAIAAERPAGVGR